MILAEAQRNAEEKFGPAGAGGWLEAISKPIIAFKVHAKDRRGGHGGASWPIPPVAGNTYSILYFEDFKAGPNAGLGGSISLA